jgi:hypothetical protein
MDSLGGAPRRGLAERIRYFAVWLLLAAISEWSWAILGMAFCLRRFLASLGVIALVMMVRRHLMALRGVVMVLGGFGVGVLGHSILL